ncbi:MAG: FAD-dependent oxidoreductase [Elusimicrobiales bacterium]|nr:FAD-dependent oxidoreductase [Elusimicrobiales bacterium]
MNRIKEHMILPVPERKPVSFTFDGKKLASYEGEVISSALIANGIHIFSRHHKDGSPQGIFCANGQCAQCTVMAGGAPVKACMTPVAPGLKVETVKGLPQIGGADGKPVFEGPAEHEPDALIIGGGPAGLAAAIELGKLGLQVILLDDKHRLGGKLVLQTHKFFGSVEDCHAGTRGIDIASKLEDELAQYPSVKVWLNTFAAAVFSDKKIGAIKDGRYHLVKPRALLVAAGAREKSLPFSGNTLPGVYGAGAFQTLVNRDLVIPCKRLFIMGGGNVGLIAAYHAIQAGIEVAGLVEALPEAGGYKVHADKIARLGVPLLTSHTVLSANGREKLESVTVAAVDRHFQPVRGTEKTFKVDTLLVAVGLNPCNELYLQAKDYGMNVRAAGDAEEIAEASAAMFGGRIAGAETAGSLGCGCGEPPAQWRAKLDVLKSRPGKTHAPAQTAPEGGIRPVFHCRQEIPCNPCVSVCPKKAIKLRGESITSLPYFDGECVGCLRCVAICPGLAVTVVDFRADENYPTVYLAFEISRGALKKGGFARVTGCEGAELGNAEIVDVREMKAHNTVIAGVKVEKALAAKVAGLRLYDWEKESPLATEIPPDASDSVIICRCERVTLGEIRRMIRAGARDFNALKAALRCCMGSCGGKTCQSLILAAFKSEGVNPGDITLNTRRPLEIEIPLSAFCNAGPGTGKVKPPLDSGNF